MCKGFQQPKRLVANTETLTDRYGMFTAQPFERGFGSTIGTGLRRVLLSSIEGAAITAVRIDGVAHEFSPIPGVVEDATDIILNLKQVPFKMMGEGTRTAYLKADSAGEVMSGQIETGPENEVLHRQVEELELSVRSYNCLKNANIQTIGDLVQKTEAEMLRPKNFGRKSLNEIKEILSGLGLTFGMKFDAQGRLVSPAGQPAMIGAGGDEEDLIEDEEEDEEEASHPAE